MYLSQLKYCKILCDVVCRPHCRRRVLCDMTFTCAPLPWEIHRFGGLNSIVIVYYNICYIFHYDKCVICEYSEYIYYVNNEYIYICTYLRLTYCIRIYIHIFVYAPPALSSPLTPICTHLAGNDLFNFFPTRCFPIVLELMTHTQYTRETHRVGPTHRAEIR